MKKVIITVTSKGAPWDEDYLIPDNADAYDWANDLLERFNSNLRPGESTRKLLEVKVITPKQQSISVPYKKHEWVPLFTYSHFPYESKEVRCTHCGIHGKRYGKSNSVTRDYLHRDSSYKECRGAK